LIHGTPRKERVNGVIWGVQPTKYFWIVEHQVFYCR